MKRFLLLVLIISFFCACNKKVDEKIVAQVNDEVLTENQFKSSFSENQLLNLSQEDKQIFVNQWINLTLFSQEGKRLGISDEAYIKEKVKLAQKKVISNAVLAQAISEINLNEDDLFDYYKLHKSKYQNEIDQYKMQRIFVSNKAKLDIVIKEMKDSLKFTDAAKKYSEETLGNSGGYTGFLGIKDVDKEIWDTVKNLKKWYYQSVKVSNGYYVIRWYEKRKVKEIRKFRNVKDEIEKIVFEERKSQLYDQIIEDLKQNSKIKISI